MMLKALGLAGAAIACVVALSVSVVIYGSANAADPETTDQAQGDSAVTVEDIQRRFSIADYDEGYAAYQRGDYATALREFRPLAEQGDVDAQAYLASMYYYGTGVPQDYEVAIKWTQQAAIHGDARSQNSLGWMYQKGEGTELNYIIAMTWYRRAADQGYAPAQVNLGFMYLNGQGAPEDQAAAVKWFRMATRQGESLGQYNLGLAYEYGWGGVAQDYAEAAKWYRMAAGQDDPYGQHSLGLLYYYGKGVRQSNVSAYFWFGQAALQNQETSAQWKELAAQDWSPSQIAALEGHIINWQPGTGAPDTSSLEPPFDTSTSSIAEIAAIQLSLTLLGYNPGPIDGIMGNRTRTAMWMFQADHGLTITNEISGEFAEALAKAIAARPTVVAKAEPKKAKLKLDSTGSGFVVSVAGHVLTNEHVVNDCQEIRVPPAIVAKVQGQDAQADLALLSVPGTLNEIATFVQGRGIRPGDDIVAAGYPLQGLLTSDLIITTGTVSALAGPGDDRRLIQITAPVQPGNSGGPLLDLAGNVVGVVVSKLDAIRVAKATGDIPQNVNFAISAWTARAFLDAYNVPYETAPSEPQLLARDVAAQARGYTMPVQCWR